MMQHPEHLRARLREALGAGPPRPHPGLAPLGHPSPACGRGAGGEGRWPQAGVEVDRPTGEEEVHHVLPGFWQDTPVGRVFVVERRFALEHRHGRLPLGQVLQMPPTLWARIGRTPALAEADPRRVVFLDTETTGLAGGTGTIAFLVGIGHFLDGHFRLRQYFLPTVEQERAMLRALADYLDGFQAVVSFNGKAFDLPLLEARLVLARMPRDLAALPHLDLLHPARRLYGDRLASCRLTELEQHLLGLTRVDDVPGWEVPALYFRYMRTRRFRALLPVFEHNATDVLSLVALTAHLASVLAGEARLTGADRLALGRVCEAEGRSEEAIMHYRQALAQELRPVERQECEQRLSLLLKRLGRWREAAALWQEVAARPDNRLLYPLVELAKYHERVTGDLAAARALTERALLLLEGHHARIGFRGLAAEREALTKRLTRLEGRMARARLKSEQRKRTPA